MFLAPASVIFQLQNIVQCYVHLATLCLFLSLPTTLGVPLPAPSIPAFCTPPALFSPVLHPPPIPLHKRGEQQSSE